MKNINIPWFYLFLITSVLSTKSGVASELLDIGNYNSSIAIGKYLSIYIDNQHNITLEKIQSVSFTNIEKDIPSWGYSTASFWFKLKLSNSGDEKTFFINIPSPTLDKITLFDGKIQMVGDQVAVEQKFVRSREPMLLLHLKSGEKKTIYINIQSTGPIEVPMFIVKDADLVEFIGHQEHGLGIYFGFLIFMLLLNIFFYFAIGENGFLIYAFFQTSFIATNLSLNGYLTQLLPNLFWFNDRSINIFASLTFLSCALFSKVYLNTKETFKRADTVVTILFIIYLIAFILILTLPKHFTPFVILITGATLLILPIIGVISGIRGYRPAIFYSVAWTSLILGVLVLFAKNTGHLPFNIFTRWALQIGSVLEVIVLTLGLAYKVRLIGIEKRENELKLLTLSKVAAIGDLASQVAHDIRSPLAALDMALKDDSSLPENKRLIVRTATNRIHEIANELLHKNRASANKDESTNDKNDGSIQKILLSSIVESIVAEKRMQYRGCQNISIQSKLNDNSYGIFVYINTRELRRIISNLINNSVEAFANGRGNITVCIKRTNNMACLEVVDDGKGIPQHIMAKLGERGVSFGKESSTNSGSGLGVFHAKSSVEKWKGQFTIESKENHGTTIRIFLPEADLPETFVPNIKLAAGQKVVVLDDDQSIHQIWNEQFESANTQNSGIEIIHFTSIGDCEKWMNGNRADIYLVDYEFGASSESGLDFIVRMKLQGRAILVTSRYEEISVQSRCEAAGIGLIPKSLAAYVPIIINQTSMIVTKQIDAVLIDDDTLVQFLWETRANDKKMILKIYSDPSEVDFSTIHKDCPIFIDSNLKNGLKGEDVATKLHNKGFKNLFLATGYEKDRFSHLTFLKGVIGKGPPW